MTPEDLDTLCRTVYGEARGEPYLGMIAVAWVVRNRVKTGRDKTIRGACLRKFQFTCWLLKDPNRAALLAATVEDRAFRTCYRAVLDSFERADPTHGATHYFNPAGASPSWAQGHEPCAKIGRHFFFNDVD